MLFEDDLVAFLRLLERRVLCKPLRIIGWLDGALSRALLRGHRELRKEEVTDYCRRRMETRVPSGAHGLL